MWKRVLGISLGIIVLGTVALAQAQKTTEIYIPIGQSPGVSGTQSVIGTIEAVNTSERSLTMTDDRGRYTVKVTDQTRIWLDRSALNARNRYGSFASLKPQLRVEVKYEGQRGDPIAAEWIKVELRDGG